MRALRLRQATSIPLSLSVGILAGASTALAQTSVKAVFEKHKLLGTFARDCSKPASRDNPYYVHRALNADLVQRDQMSGPTNRDWVNMIDKTAELKPNELTFSGAFTGRALGKDFDSKPSSGVWRVEPNRLLQWEGTINGEKIIRDGRFVSTGFQLPWSSRCGE